MSKKTAIIILFGFMIFSIVLTNVLKNTVIKNLNQTEDKKQEIVIDNEAPKLVLKESKLIIYQDDILNYESFVIEATDNVDGDLKALVEHNIIDTSKIGEYSLEYKVKDSSGNETIEILNIIIKEKLSAVGD